MQIQQNYPLAPLTTFRIGGEALFYADAENLGDLKQALDFAREKKLELFILGNGSNILVSDKGFGGLVIHNKIKGLTIEDSGLITIGAGEDCDEVVKQAVEKKFAGIECLSGVPGSAGGAIVQNIGAYGQTLSDSVVQIKATAVATGKEKTFSVKDSEFGYRISWFKNHPNKYIVTSFQLQLKPGGAPTIAYAHVAKHFEKKPNPDLSEMRQFILKLRASKGYLIMPGYESFKTAGSFFKNPIVSLEQFDKLKPMLADPSLNRYWETPTGMKIAAAYLMQESGFEKGYREGKVGISPKHSLSLVNFGEAKASEVKALADKIKSVVLEKFGVKLEEEILYV